MKSHLISIVIFSALSSLLLAAESGSEAKKTDGKPNIVIILADDMGYGDVACFNSESKIATPHLDRLAAGGMRFTDAHSGAAVCVPSRYALLTGRFAVRNKLQVRNGPIINKGRMTIASLLKKQGYKTAMVGKWHQGFELSTGKSNNGFDYSKPLLGGPVDCGFDSFFGMHASLDIPPYFYIRDRSPLMPPTETVTASTSLGSEEGWNKIQGAFWREGLIAPDFKHSEVTPRFAKEAVDVIRSHGEEKNAKPLFLYLALPSPHTPWLPSNEFRGKSGAGMYGDFVMQVDAVVGQVLESLKAAGMKQNTLVFFSSDNGPVWYDENTKKFGHDAVGGLRGMKFSSWEGGHRVPMIVRWPAKIAPDSVSEQTIVFSDVLATLAELVGLHKIPEGMAEDSVSFLPYLMNSEKAPERRAPIVHDRQTLRDGDWKLILPRGRGKQGKKTRGELYNLREDLAEQNNLYAENPDRVQRMTLVIDSLIRQAE